VQATDAARQNHFSEYLALRLTTTACALLIIAAASFIISRNSAVTLVILLVGVSKAGESITDVYRGLMQQSERMDQVAASLVLHSVAAVIVLAAVLSLNGSLPAALAATITTDLIVWWQWDFRHARQLLGQPVQPRFESAALLGLARTALPLGLVGMLLSLNSYAPQWVVKRLAGDAELGVFAALLYAAMATRVFIGALGQSASPRLANLYEAGDTAAFRKLYVRLLALAVAIGVCAIAFAIPLGRPLLQLVYGAEYASRTHLFIQLLAVAAVVQVVSLQNYIVTATRNFRPQLPVSIAVAITTLVVAVLLVPRYGTPGAAGAMLAGALIQGAGNSLVLRRALRGRESAM
jgi:O-antigen/teichoic acid export membrane protein